MGGQNTLIARLKVAGAAAFGSTLRSAAAAVRGVGSAAGGANAQAGVLGKTFGSVGSVMLWFGRQAQRGMMVAAAAIAGVAYAGIQFNSSMEQNAVAFRHFLGGTKAANTELDVLYKLAAKTPFEFQDVTAAAKQFLAFGFTVKETNRDLTTLGDVASGLGTGREGIQRMVLALGQLKTKGVVQGDELLQLQEAGVNTYKYLIAAGLITKKDIGQIGQMHLSSTKAIRAIIAGMRRDFGGLSREQSHTWAGQISTLKDNGKQLAGYATKPLFDALENGLLPKLNSAVGRLQKWGRGGGFNVATYAFGQGAKGKHDLIDEMDGGIAGKAFEVGQAVHTVVDTVRSGVRDIGQAIAPARPFYDNVIVPLVEGTVDGLGVQIPESLKVMGGALYGFATVLGFIGDKMKSHRKGIRAFAKGFAAPLDPIFQAAHMVDSSVSWIAKRLRDLLAFMDRFNARTKGAAKGIGLGLLRSLPGIGPAAQLLGGRANGGPAGRSGPYLVGERGPEVVNLRMGDDVTPNARLAAMPRMRGDRPLLHVEIPVRIGHREVDRVMARITLDGVAAA